MAQVKTKKEIVKMLLKNKVLEDKDETLKTIYKAFIYSKTTPPVGTSSFLGYSCKW